MSSRDDGRHTPGGEPPSLEPTPEETPDGLLVEASTAEGASPDVLARGTAPHASTDDNASSETLIEDPTPDAPTEDATAITEDPPPEAAITEDPPPEAAITEDPPPEAAITEDPPPEAAIADFARASLPDLAQSPLEASIAEVNEAPEDPSPAGPLEIPSPETRPHQQPHRRRARPRRPPLSQRVWPDVLIRHGVLGVLALGLLLAGGVHFASGVALSGAGIGLGLLALVLHWRETSRKFGLVGLALVAWCTLTALQLIPLPFELLESLSPRVAELYRSAHSPLDLTPEHAPLSLSPYRTAIALWHALGAAGLFFAVSLHMRTWQRFEWFVPRLLAVGGLFLFAAVVQTVLFPQSILGIIDAPAVSAPLRATLINPNHAGGVLGAFAALALGVAFTTADRGKRYATLMLYGALSVAMILTLSRGAMLAWGLSHATLLLVMKGSLFRKRWTLIAAVVVLLATSAAAMWGGERYLSQTFEQTVEEWRKIEGAPTHAPSSPTEANADADALDPSSAPTPQQPPPPTSQASISKVLIYRDLGPMYEDFSAWGIGRGAFVDVYPLYADHSLQKTFEHAENEYLEWLLEYGLLPGGLLLLLFALGVLAPLTRRDWRDSDRPLIAGVLMAITLMAVHNLFDFGLRIPAPGALFIVLIGLVVGRESRYRVATLDDREKGPAMLRWLRRQRRERPLGAAARWTLVALLIASTLTALAALPDARHGEDRDDVAALRGRIDALAIDHDGALRQKLTVIARRAPLTGPQVVTVYRAIEALSNNGRGVDVHGLQRDLEALAETLQAQGESTAALRDAAALFASLDAVPSPQRAREALIEVARGPLLARPADGYLRLLLAIGMMRTGPGGAAAALPWLEQAQTLHRFDHRVDLMLGAVLATLQRPAEAAAAFKRAGQRHKGRSTHVYEVAARRLGATEHLIASLSDEPDDWSALGHALLRLHRLDEVTALATHLEDAHPKQPTGLDLLCQIQLARPGLNFPLGALQPAQTLVERFPDRPESFLRLFEVLSRIERPTPAFETLLLGLERHPKDLRLLRQAVLFLLGPDGKAIHPSPERWRLVIDGYIDRLRPVALANRQTRPDFYVLRGDYYRALDNPRQALRAYLQAHSLRPNHIGVMIRVFDAALIMGDFKTAERTLERLTKQHYSRTGALRARFDRRREQYLERGLPLVDPDGNLKPLETLPPPVRLLDLDARRRIVSAILRSLSHSVGAGVTPALAPDGEDEKNPDAHITGRAQGER